MAHAPLPWGGPQTPRGWRDQDDREMTIWLQQNGLIVPENLVHGAVQTIAENNGFHPVMDYLTSIVWDGEPRLDEWLVTYCGCVPSDYIMAIGARWMISGVARIFEPGCKAHCVLVLEGKQGIGKSTVFEVIGGRYYSNDIAALGTKDAQEQILGVWLMEFDELEAVTRAREILAVNAFVSRSIDHFRLPYARHSQAHPRQSICGASTNQVAWHRDSTGARRWWPAKPAVVHPIEMDALRQDRDQLWAEARDRYLLQEHWWLDDDNLIAAQVAEMEQRFEEDPWSEATLKAASEMISAFYKPDEKRVTVEGVMVHMGLGLDRRDPQAGARVAKVLRHAGWTRNRGADGKICYFAPGR
jgi:predicted P-loop ATPase